MPVSGKVVAINEALPDTPEKVNSDPYGEAWMVKIEISDPAELNELLEPPAYRESLRREEAKGAAMFIPHTDEDREAMLETIGVNSLEDLFQAVPAKHRFPELNLPPALTEMEAMAEMRSIAAVNETTQDLVCFLGAGAYNHYIPPAVDIDPAPRRVLHRLHPLPARNLPGHAAGHLRIPEPDRRPDRHGCVQRLALRWRHRRGRSGQPGLCQLPRQAHAKWCSHPAVHPHYRQVVHTYNHGTPHQRAGLKTSTCRPARKRCCNHVDNDTALVIVQYPDFFGRVYDLTNLAEAVHAAGALLAVAVNPIALGLLTPPGEFGADIVVGEGQPLGIPLSFGGPYLGIFATGRSTCARWPAAWWARRWITAASAPMC